MGIPEPELTPSVQTAIKKLIIKLNSLQKDLTTAQERMVILKQEVDRDPLVPIMNRRAFCRELSRILSSYRRYKIPACLIYFDMNNFKELNDTKGHAVGDEALRHVSALLLGNIRESDALGRLGGDEFGIVLTHTGINQARSKAQSLVELINATLLVYKSEKIPLSITAGIARLEQNDTPEDLLERADRAMYRRKIGKAASA